MLPNDEEDRVALLLRGLDAQAADGILEHFSPERKNRLRTRMQQHSDQPTPTELLDRLLRDLAASLTAPLDATSGNALRVVTSEGDTVNAHRSKQLAPTLRRSGSSESAHENHGRSPNVEQNPDDDPVVALRAIQIEHLVMAFEGEHPQTVATVIHCLEPQAAGEVLKRLPTEMRRLVFLRFSQTSGNPTELAPRIVQAIVLKCRNLAGSPLPEKGDAKYFKMAELLKKLERTDRVELLAALNEQDAATAAQVKDRLYVFEDLRLIEDRSVQKLLAEVDAKTLATALKGSSEEISQKVLDNLSKRGREMVTEEMSFLGSIPSAQVFQAQKAVVDVIQRLDQAGELVMREEGDA